MVSCIFFFFFFFTEGGGADRCMRPTRNSGFDAFGSPLSLYDRVLYVVGQLTSNFCEALHFAFVIKVLHF